MFSLVGFCFLIFLHPFVLATGDIVDSTGKFRRNLIIRLKLHKAYNNTKVYISFDTAESILLEKPILFTFHHSYSRGLGKKHKCLEHCTIIFNIKEVFKHYCEDDSSYKNVCCESNESSLPPVQPTLDPAPEATDRAVLIPETSGSIHYSGPIDIVYRDDKLMKEKISAIIRLENPLKCMNWAGLGYSTTGDIVDSTNLTGKVQAHMKIGLKLLKTYNNTKAYLFFDTADNILLAKPILFTFHHSYSRGLGKKHKCLNIEEHCTIIFNIKKVFKHYCEDNSPYKNVCCESNESSLPPVQATLDPEPEAKDRETASLKSEFKSLMLPLETEVKALKQEVLDVKKSLEFLKSKFEEINSRRLHNETEIKQLSSAASNKTLDVDTMQSTNSSAVFTPETSESIHFSKPIHMRYKVKERISAQIRFENPLKCMAWADIVAWPPYKLLASISLTENDQTYTKIEEFKLVDNARIIIEFYTNYPKKLLVLKVLFDLHQSNSRDPNEQHECLKNCTITYDIKEVLQKDLIDFDEQMWCESIKSPLRPFKPAALDPEPNYPNYG